MTDLMYEIIESYSDRYDFTLVNFAGGKGVYLVRNNKILTKIYDNDFWHGLTVQPEWILSSPGVVNSIRVAIGALTQPGDTVVIQPPVYGPFAASVADCGCRVRKNCLRRTESGWEMDYDDLEKAFQEEIEEHV